MYGGCEGNGNNFNSSELCEDVCGSAIDNGTVLTNGHSCFNSSADDPTPTICRTDEEEGESEEAPELLWYFNTTTASCQKFRGCIDPDQSDSTGDRLRFFRSGPECADGCGIFVDDMDEAFYDEEEYEQMKRQWAIDDEYDEDEEEEADGGGHWSLHGGA